ncbi:putative ATPase with chaperone activity [Sphaerochaeta pleomorpha str. Grapes]|uniref:Putative ATPase with chaperone activity n=1 Tax=Sphaerochaeta pleomorpha (strain ATCC BAA-1885 / DSM 22778 / Grapes) TaxID=158190 RepID=G8QXF7_SPHPG|nr:ATP-binding protein [Sphaerochaeta pleomorpha]AEV28458.1 putative ATPase with chaperone activity [Sphaerochaeta pleomorpha str. Grapes]
MNIFGYYQNGFQGEAIRILVSPCHTSFDILGQGSLQTRQFKEKLGILLKQMDQGKPSGIIQLEKKVPPQEIELAIILSLLLQRNHLLSNYETDLLVMGKVNLDGTLTGEGSLLDAPGVAKTKGCSLLIAAGARHSNIPSLAIEAPTTLAEAFALACRFLLRHQGMGPTLPQENRSLMRSPYEVDPFWGIVGMEATRKAMVLSAAGHLNILLFGPPGGGKSMMLHRLPYLVPPLCESELRETERIARTAIRKIPSIEITPDMGEKDLIQGEPPLVSLAHNGILTLDEIAYQKPNTLVSLRTLIDRRQCKGFPCNFLVAAAMNACPCGNLGLSDGICRCNERQIAAFWNKVGSPLLDRFDLIVPVKNENLMVSNLTSKTEGLQHTIAEVRKQHLGRDEEDYRKLLPLLNRCRHSENLSLRSAISVCRTAYLIANLRGKDIVMKEDMYESLLYKTYSLDNPYWYPR